MARKLTTVRRPPAITTGSGAETADETGKTTATTAEAKKAAAEAKAKLEAEAKATAEKAVAKAVAKALADKAEADAKTEADAKALADKAEADAKAAADAKKVSLPPPVVPAPAPAPAPVTPVAPATAPVPAPAAPVAPATAPVQSNFWKWFAAIAAILLLLAFLVLLALSAIMTNKGLKSQIAGLREQAVNAEKKAAAAAVVTPPTPTAPTAPAPTVPVAVAEPAPAAPAAPAPVPPTNVRILGGRAADIDAAGTVMEKLARATGSASLEITTPESREETHAKAEAKQEATEQKRLELRTAVQEKENLERRLVTLQNKLALERQIANLPAPRDMWDDAQEKLQPTANALEDKMVEIRKTVKGLTKKINQLKGLVGETE